MEDPYSVSDVIDNLFILANTGRKGPVWIDVPIDVQATPLGNEFLDLVNVPLRNKTNLNETFSNKEEEKKISDKDIETIAEKLLSSSRPVLYVGNGVRLSDSYGEFLDFIDDWPIATVTGWNNNDLLWDDHYCYSGRPGSVGNRAGNFAVQLSDCVIIIGCRLNIRQVSFNWNSFAKNAWRCHIDIDLDELEKPTLNTDLKVNGILKTFSKIKLT